MKFIAIDYGTKKIGIALSDGLGSMAFAKDVLEYSCMNSVIVTIVNFCAENNVAGVVVGLPLYKDGKMSPLGKEACNFTSRLQKQYRASYFMINEYLTSFEAKSLADQKVKKAYIDAYSAKVILDDFLSLPEEKRILHKFIDEA